jgi:hypothetical protein
MPPQSKSTKTIVNHLAPKKSILKHHSKPLSKGIIKSTVEDVSDMFKRLTIARSVKFSENLAEVRTYEPEKKPSSNFREMAKAFSEL